MVDFNNGERLFCSWFRVKPSGQVIMITELCKFKKNLGHGILLMRRENGKNTKVQLKYVFKSMDDAITHVENHDHNRG